jgi:hypothetical protein
MNRNCVDCYHLKARIKLIPRIKAKNKITYLDKKFDWQGATASCELGFLAGENGEPKVIKNIFKGAPRKHLNFAARCRYFEGMD